MNNSGLNKSAILLLSLGEQEAAEVLKHLNPKEVQKAGFLLDRIMAGEDADGIESLRWMDASIVAELIKNEHPQIVASVLVYLERDHAADVAVQLPDKTRSDVMLRIATLDGIQPTAMRELNDVLSKLLTGSENVKKAPLGGPRTAAEILNRNLPARFTRSRTSIL